MFSFTHCRLLALLLTLITLTTLALAEPPTPFFKRYADTLPGAQGNGNGGVAATKTKPPPTKVDIRAIMGGGPIGGGSARLWKRGVEENLEGVEVLGEKRSVDEIQEMEGGLAQRDAGVDWASAESEGSTYYSDVEA